jgi:hypothetical protein
MGFPVLRALSLCTCCRQYPGAAAVFLFAQSHSRVSLPRFAIRVDPRIVVFEDCSAFTHVAACTLALSPYFVTTITRRLQPCRYLHNRSGCYWLEPWPGGTYTHRKAPPFHGAQRERSYTMAFQLNGRMSCHARATQSRFNDFGGPVGRLRR